MRNVGGIVVLLLGLAAIAFSVKTALTPHGSLAAGVDAAGVAPASAPKRQLDNVRSRAKELEKEQQQQADEMLRKTADQ